MACTLTPFLHLKARLDRYENLRADTEMVFFFLREFVFKITVLKHQPEGPHCILDLGVGILMRGRVTNGTPTTTIVIECTSKPMWHYIFGGRMCLSWSILGVICCSLKRSAVVQLVCRLGVHSKAYRLGRWTANITENAPGCFISGKHPNTASSDNTIFVLRSIVGRISKTIIKQSAVYMSSQYLWLVRVVL